MALIDITLWDGTHTLAEGYREGLPWWRFRSAPRGLATKRQLHQAGRRLARGQQPYGLLIWHYGSRYAELYRIDLSVPAQSITPAVRASVARMERARRTCRRCRVVQPRRLPMSTWMCWPCMDTTGDYGQPEWAA